MRIHKGDKVLVLSGKDRGKQSKVIRAMPSEGKVHHRGRPRRQAPREADPGHHAGRRDRQVHADYGLVGGAVVRLAAGPTRIGMRVDETAGSSGLPQVRNGPVMAAATPPALA